MYGVILRASYATRDQSALVRPRVREGEGRARQWTRGWRRGLRAPIATRVSDHRAIVPRLSPCIRSARHAVLSTSSSGSRSAPGAGLSASSLGAAIRVGVATGVCVRCEHVGGMRSLGHAHRRRTAGQAVVRARQGGAGRAGRSRGQIARADLVGRSRG